MKRIYAEVIIPLPLNDSYTYSIPEELNGKIVVGSRVVVPFGVRKYYTAIVAEIHEEHPLGFEPKGVFSMFEDTPIVLTQQLDLWRWISSYYMSSLGEVFKVALPSFLKVESKTIISKNIDNLSSEDISLSSVEKKLYNYVQEVSECSVLDVSKQLSLSNPFVYINSLIEKGVISTKESLVNRYKEKKERCVRVSKLYVNEPEDTILSLLRKGTNQVVMLSSFFSISANNVGGIVTRKDLLATSNCDASVLLALCKKGILEQYDFVVERFVSSEDIISSPSKLNKAQKGAYNEIVSSFKDKSVCLLHGVTSSGKTEVYIHLIFDELRKGKQVLFLVPEIALTTQLYRRLSDVFGDKLGVYHSSVSENKRTEVWHKMLSDSPYQIIIGARSSLFLPFKSLGLTIVDEEHDYSYKQQSPSPRYNARNVAIVLSAQNDANVLLGSATPSIESYYNATHGKYGLVSLLSRFEDRALPDVKLVNTRELRRKKMMKGLLSPDLIDNIKSSLEEGRQVILLRNRRGYAPVMECSICGWVAKCEKCDVALTFHKKINRLKCHYCGCSYPIPNICGSCKESKMEVLGSGTEQVEEEVRSVFPLVLTLRLDSDTTKRKGAYENILNSFEDNRAQILIGTQMVSKGLDFDKVSLVGIIEADGILNFPDFRSHERGFQLMTQAGGRSGRKDRRGTVIIQTTSPNLPIFKFVKEHNYVDFYTSQLYERELFRYPPFYRVIKIEMKHRDEAIVERGSLFFAENLALALGDRVLGPARPAVSRINLMYIRNIMLKVESGASFAKIRQLLRDSDRKLKNEKVFSSIILTYDVDPE